jgi:hypothetical protein
LLENNQTPAGIKIPKVLQKYTGFDIIDWWKREAESLQKSEQIQHNVRTQFSRVAPWFFMLWMAMVWNFFSQGGLDTFHASKLLICNWLQGCPPNGAAHMCTRFSPLNSVWII